MKAFEVLEAYVYETFRNLIGTILSFALVKFMKMGDEAGLIAREKSRQF